MGRALSLVAAALAGSMLTPMAAVAQSAAAPGEAEVGEVVVTGSTIIRNGYQAPTPVTTVNAGQLQVTAPTRLGEALTQLPQFRASPNPRSTYQATLGLGSATLSLRGLGSNRTLVLIDGRRYVPASQRGDYDVELIPSALLQRVDIVTGGASAQYGSDAVGGVVNLVLDKKFSGIKATVQGGVSEYGDGESWRGEIAFGTDLFGGRGRLIGGYSHVYMDEIQSQADRPWGRDFVGLVTIAGATPRNQILFGVGQPASFGGAVISGPLVSGNTGIQFLPGGVVAPYNLGSPRSAAATVNADGTHIVQPISSGLKNDNLFLHLDFDASDTLRLYGDVIAAKQRGFFFQGYPNFQFGTNPFTIFSGNPYLPAPLQGQLAAQNIPSFQLQRMSRDLGYTYAHISQEVLNLTAGFEGDAGGWTYGGNAVYGRNAGNNVLDNNLNQERMYAAVDAVRDPASGQVVCRVTLTNPGLYPGCVPLNVLGDGSPSQAAIDYVRLSMPWQPKIVQTSATAYVRGEPFSTWAGPVALGFGGELRKQTLRQKAPAFSSYINQGIGIRGFPTSLVNRQGGFTTLNVQPARGDVTMKEGYAEVLVPLAKDTDWAQSLDFNAAARYTHYSTSGGVTTWKVGLTYQPVSDARFRATYSKDIRAPNLGELYVAGSSAQTAISDPQLAGRSYLTFARGTPAPDLDPESGKTYSLGVVLTPSFLPGFSASIDYFNIKISGLISTLTAQQTVDACNRGSEFNCSLITRDATTNEIQRLLLPSQNLSKLETDGVDLDVSYGTEFAGGTVRLRGFATYTPNYILTVPGAPPIDYAGEIGVGANTFRSIPKLSATFSLNYERGPFSGTIQQRYIDNGTYDVTLTEGVNINDNSVPHVWYTDLTLQYRLRDVRGEPELFLTVNNLWNKDPPLFPNGSAVLPTQFNRLLHDGIGRYYTAGLRVSF